MYEIYSADNDETLGILEHRRRVGGWGRSDFVTKMGLMGMKMIMEKEKNAEL